MGKIVVKNIQSQNSTTAFKIPSSDGTAGQFLETDGAGNLSWGAPSDFKSADGSSLTYTLPNTDGTTGQFLQSNSTGGDTKWASVSSPTATPDGTKQGWNFIDKFVADDAGSVNEVNLTVPTSMTTDGSNIIAYKMDFYSLSGEDNNSNASPRISCYLQDGSTVACQTDAYSNWHHWNSQNGHQAGSTSYSYTAGSGYRPNTTYFGAGTNYTTNSGKKTYGSTGYLGGGLSGTFFWWNARGNPQGWMNAHGPATITNWTNYNGMTYGYVTPTDTTNPYHTTNNRTMSWKFQFIQGGAIRNGTVILSGYFKNGVL